ncbi:hypothetical protein RHECNPAF_9300159 [Rhizobium etli CNPAF512]|nr:hypothetical protein RHECNPAF_9300159 [Rhizobium etli CNPAF512]
MFPDGKELNCSNENNKLFPRLTLNRRQCMCMQHDQGPE